ncbi:MAG: hypothetical protein WB799_18530 [Candidatus Sulfotelmatobacter sp.]
MSGLTNESYEAFGLIVAAIIAGVVAFLSLIISKEQSVSEFRQQWIDALRKDIAIVVGRVIAIQGESLAKHKEDWTGFHRVIVRIRLRLNPNEAGKKEGPATKAVLATLVKLESMFASASVKTHFHELDDLVKTLVDNSQVILKENWDRVRSGETTYQITKWTALVFTIAFIVLSIASVYHFSSCVIQWLLNRACTVR